MSSTWKFLGVYLPFLIYSSSVQALTLDDIYKSAIEKTSVIQDKKYAEKIAKEQESQAIGAVLPTLAAVSTNTWRDEIEDIGPFGEGYQHFGAMNLTQPIFQGGGLNIMPFKMRRSYLISPNTNGNKRSWLFTLSWAKRFIKPFAASRIWRFMWSNKRHCKTA